MDWWKNTLETSGEDLKLHSKRVKKMLNYTPNTSEKHSMSQIFISLGKTDLASRLNYSSTHVIGLGETYSRIVLLRAIETYSRIGLLRSYWNLQSYLTTTKLLKLTVVLDYYEAMETYSRISLLRSYWNLQ
jgi:hypothetical protein